MDCGTARLLIEAHHDDEIGVADAAHLMAHLDGCIPCAAQEEASRGLKSLWRARRPVDRCPDEVKRRIAACLGGPERTIAPRPARAPGR